MKFDFESKQEIVLFLYVILVLWLKRNT